jgi:hypothetical protein
MHPITLGLAGFRHDDCVVAALNESGQLKHPVNSGVTAELTLIGIGGKGSEPKRNRSNGIENSAVLQDARSCQIGQSSGAWSEKLRSLMRRSQRRWI